MLNDTQKEEAKALLMARAFSIKNRACGVSQDFNENARAYSDEIQMYAKMYVAEVRQGKGFDEAKWMAENGYEDMVASHIPFSEQSKEKIFTLAGIKSQVEGAREGKVAETIRNTGEAIRSVAQLGKEGLTNQGKMVEDGGTR